MTTAKPATHNYKHQYYRREGDRVYLITETREFTDANDAIDKKLSTTEEETSDSAILRQFGIRHP